MKEFTSELDDYPGSFSLPEPFLERHMRAWWEVAIKPLEGMSELAYERYDAEWQGTVKLIREFGKWDIEAVSIGDLDSDAIPMEIKAWVNQDASLYVFPFLPLAIKRKMLGVL